jgi:hypothetical protein
VILQRLPNRSVIRNRFWFASGEIRRVKVGVFRLGLKLESVECREQFDFRFGKYRPRPVYV